MSRFAPFIMMILLACWHSATFAQAEGEAAGPATMYYDIDPAFVLNYGNGTNGRLKFMRVELTLRLSTSGSVIGDVNLHMPAIRHAVIMHLSKQSSERINDATQRDTLRQELLLEVQAVLAAAGTTDGVEDLLFNAFIVQR